jgi:hypothetical protein
VLGITCCQQRESHLHISVWAGGVCVMTAAQLCVHGKHCLMLIASCGFLNELLLVAGRQLPTVSAG